MKYSNIFCVLLYHLMRTLKFKSGFSRFQTIINQLTTNISICPWTAYSAPLQKQKNRIISIVWNWKSPRFYILKILIPLSKFAAHSPISRSSTYYRTAKHIDVDTNRFSSGHAITFSNRDSMEPIKIIIMMIYWNVTQFHLKLYIQCDQNGWNGIRLYAAIERKWKQCLSSPL